MSNKTTYLTESCKCPDHEWEIERKETIHIGKNFGKSKYLVYCRACNKQWYTMSFKTILKHIKAEQQ